MGARGPAEPAQGQRVLRRNFAITTSGLEDPLVLRFCADKLGIDNIMWTIDYPYQPTAPAVPFLESAPLSDQAGEQVAHGNAERIFELRL